MVVLTEQIEIPASYEKLEAWTANFKERHLSLIHIFHHDCSDEQRS